MNSYDVNDCLRNALKRHRNEKTTEELAELLNISTRTAERMLSNKTNYEFTSEQRKQISKSLNLDLLEEWMYMEKRFDYETLGIDKTLAFFKNNDAPQLLIRPEDDYDLTICMAELAKATETENYLVLARDKNGTTHMCVKREYFDGQSQNHPFVASTNNIDALKKTITFFMESIHLESVILMEELDNYTWRIL